MAFFTIGNNDVVMVTLLCRMYEQLSENILYYVGVDGAGVRPSIAQVANDMDVILGPALQDCISSLATYEGGKYQKIKTTKEQSYFTNTNAGPGTRAATILPRQTAGLARRFSGLAGHGNIGRMYFPFPTEADNVDVTSQPSAGYQTALANFMSASVAVITVANGGLGHTDMAPCLYHRLTGTTTIVTSWAIPPLWASQRRRGSFGRPNPLTV